MTQINNQFASLLVSPLNFPEDIKKCNFHTWDLSGIEIVNGEPDVKKKEIFIVPGKKNISHKKLLRDLGLKACLNACNYLLGVTFLLEKYPDRYNPWGKYLIAIDPNKPLVLCRGEAEGFVTVDFSYYNFKRLTITYNEEVYDEKFLILAEKK